MFHRSFLLFALATTAWSQVPTGHFAVSGMTPTGLSQPMGLATVDPVRGFVQPIVGLPGQPPLENFVDVLVETSTRDLFAAHGPRGAFPGRLEHLTLQGFHVSASRVVFDFGPREIARMCHGPNASLWVLVVDPTMPGGELFEVDPRGLVPPRLEASWNVGEGTPVAVCSDGTNLHVACEGSSEVELWTVTPGLAKRSFAYAPPLSVPLNDLEYAAHPPALELSLRGGGNYRIDLALGTWDLNWLSFGDSNRACLAPADGLFYFMGPEPGAAPGEATIQRWEGTSLRQITVRGVGDLTSVHLHENWRPSDGSFQVFDDSYSCSGSSGVCRIVDRNGPPNLGNASYELGFTTSFAPTRGVLLMGIDDRRWGASFLPYDLEPFGAPPGCAILVSGEVQWPLAVTNPWFTQPFPIPSDPALAGASLYLQLWIEDPGVARLPFVGSPGVELVLR